MTPDEELRAGVLECRLCPLVDKQEAGARVVPAQVGREYRAGGIAVLLDAPGYYEAQKGLAVTGKHGKTFADFLNDAGLSLPEVMVTNLVRHRPPNNRLQDYPEATFACGHWLTLEMQIYAPSIIICMGRAALQEVFGKEASVGRTRGRLRSLPSKHPWGHRVVMAAQHPVSAALDASVGPQIVADLQRVRRAWEVLS